MRTPFRFLPARPVWSIRQVLHLETSLASPHSHSSSSSSSSNSNSSNSSTDHQQSSQTSSAIAPCDLSHDTDTHPDVDHLLQLSLLQAEKNPQLDASPCPSALYTRDQIQRDVSGILNFVRAVTRVQTDAEPMTGFHDETLSTSTADTQVKSDHRNEGHLSVEAALQNSQETFQGFFVAPKESYFRAENLPQVKKKR